MQKLGGTGRVAPL